MRGGRQKKERMIPPQYSSSSSSKRQQTSCRHQSVAADNERCVQSMQIKQQQSWSPRSVTFNSAVKAAAAPSSKAHAIGSDVTQHVPPVSILYMYW